MVEDPITQDPFEVSLGHLYPGQIQRTANKLTLMFQAMSHLILHADDHNKALCNLISFSCWSLVVL